MTTYHKYSARVLASKEGSIGTKYCEARRYDIEARNPDDVTMLAIQRAYDEGLEHVLVTKIELVS